MKKALFVIAPEKFRNEEYFIPKDILKKGGVEVVTASTKKTASGFMFRSVKTDILLKDVSIADYDAIIFAGGPGARAFFDDRLVLSLAREMNANGAIVAAICIAPVILARADILRGKKATVWSSSEDTTGIDEILKGGAIFDPAPVVRDGNVITADKPIHAEAFGKAVLEALSER